jgi:hypothetical protein
MTNYLVNLLGDCKKKLTEKKKKKTFPYSFSLSLMEGEPDTSRQICTSIALHVYIHVKLRSITCMISDMKVVVHTDAGA